MRKIIILLSLLCPLAIFASSFPMPTSNNSIVGQAQAAQLKANDDFSVIAKRFDIGYYSIHEANPKLDPDNPKVGSDIIIPTQYVLPQQLNLKKNNIVVNLAEMRLYYFNSNNKRIYVFPIGIGKEGWVTPEGSFHIIDKIKHPVWYVPKSIQKYRAKHNDAISGAVAAGKNNPMGNYALRLSNRDYLIHGTDDPVGIGRRSSAGCIRMYPKDIKKLFNMVKVNTPVIIINKPYKAGILNNTLYLEAHMPLYEQRIKMHGNYAAAITATKKIAQQHDFILDKELIIKIAKEHADIPQIIDSKAS